MKAIPLFLVFAAALVPGLGASPLRDSLAMFETGATSPRPSAADHVRGGSGEISRFQIMPDVWRAYTRSKDHTNPEVAWTVTQRILNDRVKEFQKSTGREPQPLEIYLLWNKPGHFAATGYDLGKVSKLYRERAQRFENLYQRINVQPVVGAQ